MFSVSPVGSVCWIFLYFFFFCYCMGIRALYIPCVSFLSCCFLVFPLGGLHLRSLPHLYSYLVGSRRSSSASVSVGPCFSSAPFIPSCFFLALLYFFLPLAYGSSVTRNKHPMCVCCLPNPGPVRAIILDLSDMIPHCFLFS